ncbi:MAG TPA: DUF5667 domain-containing protein [Dehalococcoidia bacterium]
MSEFESILDECIEAMRAGRMDLDACLARYPQHADALRPQLTLAASLAAAYEAEPREEFATAARERFLVASGQRLSEAYDIEPSPSFFAAARVRFLMAAQRMRLGENAPKRPSFPVFGTPFRALATGGLAVAAFLSFSTYTVASASAALPGDWQYGVKLQTERVRLALALSDDAKRDVKFDIASERADEIQKLTAKGKIIGPGVLDRLTDATQPLVQAADEGKLDNGDLARLHDVSLKQRTVLQQAEPQVASDAGDKFAEAKAVAADAEVIALAKASGPIVKEPDVIVTPGASPSPDASATPADASPTLAPGETPVATPPIVVPTPARAALTVDQTPVDEANGIIWNRLAVSRFTTLIPSEKNGWRVVGFNPAEGPAPAPSLVRLSNIDGTSLITINPRTGDMYWFFAVNGTFDEIQMRLTRNGEIYVQDRDSLMRLYGASAEIPLYVLDNIEIAPEPTATPTAAPTATPPPTP